MTLHSRPTLLTRVITGTSIIVWMFSTATCLVAADGRLENRQIAEVRGFHDEAISSDGTKVAIYVLDPTYRNSSGKSVPSRLELRDVNSLRTDSVIDLPIGEQFGLEFQWSKALPRVQYCDGSRYVFVYLGEGVSAVVNAETGKKYTIKIDRPTQTGKARGSTLIAASCAERTSLAAFEVVAEPESISQLEFFDLDEGKKIKETDGGNVRGASVGVSVSASGDHVATYATCQNDELCSGIPKEVRITDTRSEGAVKFINTGFTIGQVSFVDDDSIAVVGTGTRGEESRLIKIFSLSDGLLKSRVGNLEDSPVASAFVSANGQFLFAYTGKEDHCESCREDTRGYLQIHDARFVIWDLKTKQVIARSPSIPPFRIRGGILEDGQKVRSNQRPRFQFSASGNAVLVTNTRDSSAVSVFLLKQANR